jgi:hypothetical protein
MLAMHLMPSIFGSKIQPLLEKILPEIANIGFIGIMNLATRGLPHRFLNTRIPTVQHYHLGPAKARLP